MNPKFRGVWWADRMTYVTDCRESTPWMSTQPTASGWKHCPHCGKKLKVLD